MRTVQYSTDDGVTWQDIQNSVRFIFPNVDEDFSTDDDCPVDLHVTVTSEGIIMDAFTEDGEFEDRTACLDIDYLYGLTE